MINSVLNEGVRGMQQSQREMHKSAHEIAHANVRQDASVAQDLEDSAIPPVYEPQKSGSTGDIAEPLIELRRQELLFTASARVVSVADDTLGSLLDVSS